MVFQKGVETGHPRTANRFTCKATRLQPEKVVNSIQEVMNTRLFGAIICSMYLSGRASKALTEATQPAHDVLWSASLASSSFSTTMSLMQAGAAAAAAAVPAAGSRAFLLILSLAQRET